MFEYSHPIGHTTDISTRPQCSVPGCTNLAVNASHKKGFYFWRRSNWIAEQHPTATDIWCCSKCHNDNTARKHGLSSSRELTAKRAGFASVLEYQHAKHPYLWARKDFCENIDGRLGHKCTTNVWWSGMLQVDHIDGDHTNNVIENFQTLCACCHSYKSWKNGDYKTPGRKTRKKESSITNIYISDSTVNISSK